MKFDLPENHGASNQTIEALLPYFDSDGNHNITDAQYEALANGIAKGRSMLLVAPTSSGKTDVGLIAIAEWINKGDGISERAVYLVSHRALARQKFNQIRNNLSNALGVQPDEVVVATGDYVIDGLDDIPGDPLSAKLLIATYEKFLAMLSSGGFHQNMDNICIVADEIQLITDPNRGRSLEILFTMIRAANPGQVVALSAVLSASDTELLSSWLNITPIRVSEREVPLIFELRSEKRTWNWRTDKDIDVEEIKESRPVDTISILDELAKDRDANFPVAVFCMTKKTLNTNARLWAKQSGDEDAPSIQMLSELEESTSMTDALVTFVTKGMAIHTADLIDGERLFVENLLDQDQLPVVFATTTLAQGLNYSFKTVIIDSWLRYDADRRIYRPISISEFHNMAGRSGRLGKQKLGKVIFTAHNEREEKAALKYLTSDISDQISGMIDVDLLDQFILQLVTSEYANTTEGILNFISNSLTGYLESRRNEHSEDLWVQRVDSVIGKLSESGFLA